MIQLQTIFVLSLLSFCSFVIVKCDIERKLTVTLNPKCTNSSYCDQITLVHVTAESKDDMIHYVWDFTGIPGFLLAKTDLNTSLNIDWNNFSKGEEDSLNFSSSPHYVFSAILPSVKIFDDPSDKANIADETVKSVVSLNPHEFVWHRENLTETEESAVLIMRAFMKDNENSSIAMRLSAFADTAHSDELPHLFHSSQSMQLDLIAKNLTSNFTQPRVAVELFYLTTENKSEGSFKFNKRRNLDDEFTPGIFDVYDIVSPRSKNDTRGAFFQYRPVCYINKYRTVSGSTELHQGNISSLFDEHNGRDDVNEFFKYTLPYSYFGYDMMGYVVQGMNITFGSPLDGFYSRTNYTSFSVLMGIGGAPIEALSSFVVIFAIIGLGVPLIVLFFGGIYVGIKRYR